MARKYKNPEIDPDQIFSDSLNIPGFNEDQFEGRIERPISKYVVVSLGLFFLFIGLIFGSRVWTLQVLRGSDYTELSLKNHLRNIPIFSERGIIYDRNNVELAWNTENKDTKFSTRSYLNADGLGHTLGFVSMPKLDQSGKFWQTESIGKDGVEKSYDDILKGKNGTKVVETDAAGNIKSESVIEPPEQGKNINLTIDSRINQRFYSAIAGLAGNVGFSGGAGVIMDVNTGEILSLVSYPEYRSEAMMAGGDGKTINSYLNDKRTPFLNRAVSGLYTPGSIVKPVMAMAALSEGVIDPLKKILSTGSISIPNPYNPELPTVFKDWKAHGWVDMRHAIAFSSDVYFYEVGGGYQDQKGLGIANIEKYVRLFGLGQKTGIDLPSESVGTIPSPEWKAENFNGEKWLVGNTYHTAIGQYGFQATPVQMVRVISAIANNGNLVTPRIVKDGLTKSQPKNVNLNPQNFSIVKEGMRLSATEGTGSGLNIPGISIATKTGTAELGARKDYVNSWVVGFFPYENPKYAFAVVMERGPVRNLTGGVYVMRQVLEWMMRNTPEYLK
ncbi:MAG: penicillin-binding transpeptidase domain-containing protein [Candidatus Paceibacterota bacterium]|jgi:penicillin-binding protein 2